MPPSMGDLQEVDLCGSIRVRTADFMLSEPPITHSFSGNSPHVEHMAPFQGNLSGLRELTDE